MDICGTDNLLELKQGQEGPDGPTGPGEVTEILSIRGALSIPYINTGKVSTQNGAATHTFSEIIRTKTVADPSGVFKAIVSGNFALDGSAGPTDYATITLTNFLNVNAKLFSCHVSINALVAITLNTTVTSGTALPAITDSKVGLTSISNYVDNLTIQDINENAITIGIYTNDGYHKRWQDILNSRKRGFYYSLTIFAVKD